MTPYDAERQQDIDAEWDRVYEGRELDQSILMTDEQVKALGLKEYKPGYYYHDPRYPRLDPETRYLLDHPERVSWVDRRPGAPPPRFVPEFQARSPRWAEDMFAGDPEELAQRTEPKRVPVRSVSSESRFFSEDLPIRTTSLWLCQVCRKAFALWPREISWRRMVWGVRVSLVLRAPYVCTNCRIMRFKEQQPLGHLEHRPFWNNVIALVTGQSRTEISGVIRWINLCRKRHGW
jgi:hypothetical protein